MFTTPTPSLHRFQREACPWGTRTSSPSSSDASSSAGCPCDVPSYPTSSTARRSPSRSTSPRARAVPRLGSVLAITRSPAAPPSSVWRASTSSTSSSPLRLPPRHESYCYASSTSSPPSSGGDGPSRGPGSSLRGPAPSEQARSNLAPAQLRSHVANHDAPSGAAIIEIHREAEPSA